MNNKQYCIFINETVTYGANYYSYLLRDMTQIETLK